MDASKPYVSLYGLNQTILAWYQDEKNMEAFRRWYESRYGKPYREDTDDDTRRTN